MSSATEYGARAREYLENARRLLSDGEVEKAGECVWGAMAQALKAVAAIRGSPIRSHTQLRSFARNLAVEMKDSNLFQDFLAAEQMHSNFYEATLQREDVAQVLERTATVIETLLQAQVTPS